jgi:hypothetical protein
MYIPPIEFLGHCCHTKLSQPFLHTFTVVRLHREYWQALVLLPRGVTKMVKLVERGDGSYDSTSLFWITYAFTVYTGYVQVLYTDWCIVPACTQAHAEATRLGLHKLVLFITIVIMRFRLNNEAFSSILCSC